MTESMVATIETIKRRSADGYVVAAMKAQTGEAFGLGSKRLICASRLLTYDLVVRRRPDGSVEVEQDAVLERRDVDAALVAALLAEASLAPQLARSWTARLRLEGAAATMAALEAAPWYARCVADAPTTRIWCRFDEYAFWHALFGIAETWTWDAAELDRLRAAWNESPTNLALEGLVVEPMVLADAVDATPPPGFRQHPPLTRAQTDAVHAYQHLLVAYHETHTTSVPLADVPSDALERLGSAVVVVDGHVYARFVWTAMDALRQHLARVGGAEELWLNVDDPTLDADQRAALGCVRAHPVTLITGAPGTGKTHLIRCVVRAVGSACVTALTGKACCNLVQRGVPARTLHSLACRNESMPDVRALIVDEISMVDVHTLLRVLPLLPALRRVVFVGDPDQLLPVAPGAVLTMLGGRLPTAALTTNHRVHAASRALAAAASTLRTRSTAPLPFKPLAEATKTSTLLHAAWDGDRDTLAASVEGVLEATRRLWPKDAKEIQFITFTNRHAATINDVCSTAFHPKRPERGFVAGDRLCFARNLRHKGVAVANGQLARIRKILDVEGRKRGRSCASTAAPRPSPRHVRVVELDDGTTLDWATFRDAAGLGYGVTVHRAQGAEAPIVAFVLASAGAAYDGVTLRLLYTALTRASRRFVLVGAVDAFRRAAQRVDGVDGGEGDPMFACLSSEKTSSAAVDADAPLNASTASPAVRASRSGSV